MTTSTVRATAASLALVTFASLSAGSAACRTAAPGPTPERAPTSPPPSSAEARRPAAPARDTTPAARPRRGYTEADVRFMQGMIAHHAQALALTDLLPSRTARADLTLLAERITVSQRDEIAMMQRWLRARGEEVPDPAHAQHGGGGHLWMPGMLTGEEMARLAALTGAAFDRRFLESMIRHHEGALAMVRALFASPGAAQESEMYRFASDVDADQRAEIARMRVLLGARQPQ